MSYKQSNFSWVDSGRSARIRVVFFTMYVVNLHNFNIVGIPARHINKDVNGVIANNWNRFYNSWLRPD